MRVCDILRDLVSFRQFKKREKRPWRSVNFSEVAGWKNLLKLKPQENPKSFTFQLYLLILVVVNMITKMLPINL